MDVKLYLKKSEKSQPKPSISQDAVRRLQEAGGAAPGGLLQFKGAELLINTSRVFRIMEHAFRRLVLLAKLPNFMREHADQVAGVLQPLEADMVLMVCQKYMSGFDSNLKYEVRCNLAELYSVFSNVEAYESDRKKCAAMQDVHLMHIIDLIFRSKELVRYLEQYETTIDPALIVFFSNFRKVLEIIENRFLVSGRDDEKYHNELKEAYTWNTVLTESIAELEEELRRQQVEMSDSESQKIAQLELLNETLSTFRQSSKHDLDNMILNSEKAMMKEVNAAEVRTQSLQEAADMATKQYDELLHTHMAEEKRLRARALKTEMQLVSWIAKYDADIGERHAEYERLKGDFDAEKEEMDRLQQAMDEQEELYNELMEEKEQIERQIYEEKAYIFLCNRAARIIQRAFRAYIERKKARRKARKAKKGAVDKTKGGK